MSTERPHISEKVKFWEEQDRINQELIPRVLKQHELFTTHIAGHEDSTLQMAAMEARMVAAVKATRRSFLLVSGVGLSISVAALIAALII